MVVQRKFFILMGTLFMALGCSNGKAELEFTAGFGYEFKDNNKVSFYNESDGEYYSLLWDFGVGEPILSTDKKATYDIYYPLGGEYEVSLQVNNYTGASKTSTKSLSIDKDALDVSFSAQIDPERPNYVILVNTSLGDFDSFTWLYRDKEVMDETEHMAYFPFAGKYQIELRLNKDDQTVSASQDIVISEDDPEYEGTYKLVWSDEFDGSAVNLDHWSFETGASGWGNNELQNYTAGENVEVIDGKLIITARKIDDLQQPGSYTSTRLKSGGKKEFTYGRMEIRAKLPSGTGIWPATWMLGSSFSNVGWPACGEIDIMEYVGYQPNTIHSTVHTSSGFGITGDGNSKTLETCEEEFHVYGLLWTEEKLVFYTDSPDNVTHIYNPVNKTEENWPFDQSQFFILNVAVGGNWGGAQGIDNSIFPQSMEIDYVRVYQEVY